MAEKYPNVHVVNTKQCSAAQGLLITEVACAIEASLPIEAVLARAEALIPKTQFWFMIHDMSALIRSGRINKIIGKVAQLSGLKPIFSLNADGKPHLVGQAFSEANALQKILHQVLHRVQAGETLKNYCLVQANAPELIQSFSKQAEKELGMPALYLESTSVTIGVHAGSGCVGLAAVFE